MDEAMEWAPDESAKCAVLNEIGLLKKLLQNLQLNDLLKCRLVNRKWKLAAESLRFEGLSVRKPDKRFTRTFFFPDFSSIKEDQLFLTSNPEFLRAQLMQTTLSNLKRLFIDVPHSPWQKKHDLFTLVDWLNQLQKLVQLQILMLGLTKKCSLRLAELEHFSILSVSGPLLKIDCPKLRTFESGCSLNRFEFVHPDRITCCKAAGYEKSVENLQNLELYWCRSLGEMETGVLKRLPKLKALHCGMNARIELLENLLSDRLKLKRLEFKIFYAGLKIETSMDLAELPVTETGLLFDVNTSSPIFLDHYARLDKVLPYNFMINYSRLVESKHFNDPIDMDKFFGRFVDIQQVDLNGVVTDKQQFVKFVRRCDHLSDLNLHFGRLDQEFYDALSDYQPYIVALSISEVRPLRLDFLCNFKHLRIFYYNHVPKYSEFSNPFSSHDWLRSRSNLREFKFKPCGKSFRVNAKVGGEFELVLKKRDKLSRLSYTVETMNFSCMQVMLKFMKILIPNLL